MNRTKQITKNIGWHLRINRSGERGSVNWERVGFVFNSKYEAEQFLKSRYPAVKSYTITGVNINTVPFEGRKDNKNAGGAQ